MEQVILDHLNFHLPLMVNENLDRSDDHYPIRVIDPIYKSFGETETFIQADHLDIFDDGDSEGLISLFGIYPNFFITEDGIESNKSRYTNLITQYYFSPVLSEFSITIDNKNAGISLNFEYENGEFFNHIYYYDNGMKRKEIRYEGSKRVIYDYEGKLIL